MRVQCVGINYFTQTRYQNDGVTPLVTGAASVNFSAAPVEGEEQTVDQFALTFNNISGNVDYWPGKFYDVTFTPVQD